MQKLKNYWNKADREWFFKPIIILIFLNFLGYQLSEENWYSLNIGNYDWLPTIHSLLMGVLLGILSYRMKTKNISFAQAIRTIAEKMRDEHVESIVISVEEKNLTKEKMNDHEFLKGFPVESLKSMLSAAVKDDDFEYAAKLRDILKEKQ